MDIQHMTKRYILKLNGSYEIYDRKARKIVGKFVDCNLAINKMVNLNNKVGK